LALKEIVIVFFCINYDCDESLNVMRDLHSLLTLQNVGVISLVGEAKHFSQDFQVFCWPIIWLSAPVQAPGLIFWHLQNVVARCISHCIL